MKSIISKSILENNDKFYPTNTIEVIDNPVRTMKARVFNTKLESEHLVITLA